MALNGEPQTKAIITHGFVVDDKGRKMAKSRGNAVDPQTIIEKYGADVLWLWCASVDYERDVPMSEKMLKHVAENYRKLRNTDFFFLIYMTLIRKLMRLIMPICVLLIGMRLPVHIILTGRCRNSMHSMHLRKWCRCFYNIVRLT